MIDIEKFKDRIKILELKLLKDDIDLTKIKGTDKIDFIDNNGYKYSLNTGNINVIVRRKTSPNIFFGGNPFYYDNINNYLKLNNLHIKLVSKEIKNAISNCEWRCEKHNYTFIANWNKIKTNNTLCPICGKERFHDNRAYSTEEIKEKAKKFDIEILEDKYINNETKMKFICNKHKDKGVQYKTWGQMITKKCPCIYCSKEDTLQKIRKSNEDFQQEFYKIHGDKYELLSEYVDSKTKVKIKCNKCGHVFESRTNHLLEGHGCPNCVKSKGEERVEVILKNKNIYYIREYRFDECIGIKKKMPFDFYLPNNNTCIEYQGKQHYTPMKYFGGEEGFKKQQINDNLKRKYCKENNIKLIEIPYWDFNKIEDYIDEIKEISQQFNK